MKPGFLEYLRCTRCTGTDFTRNIISSDNDHWHEGTLTCRHCLFDYTIRRGVLDTLPVLGDNLDREYEAFLSHYHDSQVSRLQEEEKIVFIRGLPDSAGDAYTRVSFEETLRYMHPLKGERVLDLGSGLSWTSREFARQGAWTIALDLIDHQLFSAGLYTREQGCYFERVRSNMETLPFRDCCFDVVFSRASAHHSPNLIALFREISRVLVPGGRIFLSQEPIFGVFQRSALRRFGAEGRELGSTENCYTVLEWKTGIRMAGMQSRFIFLSDGIAHKLAGYQELHRYSGVLWRIMARIIQVPLLLKLLKICYISPLHYMLPVNLLITGEKHPSAGPEAVSG